MDETEKLLKSFEETIKKNSEKKEPYIKSLIDRLNISRECALSLIPPFNEISYTPNEFAITAKYYCDIFNGIENLKSFVEAQNYIDIGFDIIERKKTIFTVKPCTLFGNRMGFFQDFFDIEKDDCISLIIKNPDWLYHKEQYFVDKTQALTEFFCIERKDLINLYIKFPFVLGKRLNRLSSLIKKIATHYGVTESKVKELMLEYPLLMNRGMYFYLNNKLGKEIFDKHWLLECLTEYSPFNYGGYRTFTNLFLVTNKIETDIGKVIKVYKKKYKDGTFIALLVEKDNKLFLVSLGANVFTPTQRKEMIEGSPERLLLEKIFGETKITEIQEYDNHKEYICQLNTKKKETINDILQTMAGIASLNAYHEVSFRPDTKVYYLSNSEDISPYSLDWIKPLSNDEYNLNVDFYKIEPIGDGKMRINPLDEPVLDEENLTIYLKIY